MEMMKVDDLKAHPKNDFFFDDIEGENWSEFLESVKTRGVIEPLVITPEKIIVSGHQRARACRELSIKEVKAEIRLYDNEDQVLQDLIETNLRQRGIGNPNAVKLGRCIKELERIYGIKNGRPLKETSNNVGNKKSQEALLKELGMNKETYRQAKKLASLPKELQQMVEEGKITASTASRVIAGLSDDEKKKLLDTLEPDRKYTQKEVQAYIDKIAELEAREPEIKEVIPEDYKQIKAELKKLQESKDDPQAVELHRSALMFNAGIANFIEEFGGYIWITAYLDIMQESDKKGFLSGINALEAWIIQMKQNLGEGGVIDV
ncbi:MAG: ParB/RepB/Spo0J family partition protein [Roseburia sp.]|nr:ParB/RepB/Spo0J family partition protein [Roseburia sp.]